MTTDERARPLERHKTCTDLLGHELHAPDHLSPEGRERFWTQLREALAPWAATPSHDWIYLDTCKTERRAWDDNEIHAAILRVVGSYNLPAGPDYPGTDCTGPTPRATP